jgi:uncharacterized protein (TIGR02118 family)
VVLLSEATVQHALNQSDNRRHWSYAVSSDLWVIESLVRRLLSPAIKGIAVEQGIAGMGPGSPAPYVAMGHLLFDSVETFQTSFEPHAQAIMSDILNYTDIQPNIQISEVKL